MRGKDGKFKEGNPGRPKGATNKTSREIREAITQALAGHIESIPQLIDELENPKDKLDALSKFVPYVMGKMANVLSQEEENEKEEDGVNVLDLLTDEQTSILLMWINDASQEA